MFFNGSNSREKGNFNKFSSFASLNFNLTRNKLRDLLTWEPKMYLKQPLLNLHPSLITHALNANKIIVDYTDSDTIDTGKTSVSEISNLDIERVSNLVSLGCEVSSQEVRDEIYCQLIKQTTGNMNRTSYLRGYQLILSCLAAFSPSQELTPFLSSHLHVGCLGGAVISRQIVRLAESCLRALKMVKILGSRSWGLTRSEIVTIISETSGISMKVWFSKSQGIDIIVDSWTTIKELTIAACDKLGIDCSPIMTLCLISTSPDEQLEANSASCRGVLNTAYNHLYRHYIKLKDPVGDVIKCPMNALFGVEKRRETFDLSGKVGRALDDFLQILDLSQLEISSGYYLNISEYCVEQAHARKPPSNFNFLQCLSSTCSIMLREKKHAIPEKTDDEVVLRMHLVIWIFPHVGFYESPNSEVKVNTSGHCKLFQCDYDAIKIYRDKWAEKSIVIFDEFSTRLCDECHISERESTTRNRICWPLNMVARNVLFAQLTDVIADKRPEHIEDIDTLRMIALKFAEQHQVIRSGVSSTFYTYDHGIKAF
jgi:MyTH4 domain